MIKEYFKIPKSCPTCDTPTIFEGEYLICKNDLCPSRLLGNLQKWISIQNIEECGIEFLNDVSENLDVKDIADLYRIEISDLINLPGYQETKAEKIISNINAKKELLFENFFAGLNISGLGTSTFTSLKSNGYTLEKLKNSSIEELKIPGIGIITSQSIYEAFHSEKILKLIDKLFSVGVKIKEDKVGKLTGMSFCFTGEISIKRGDAMKLVKDLGGEVKSSVSKGLTYLVQSNPQSVSSKSEKAKKYGTKILGEKDFLDLVDFSFEKLLV
jgi:DNA ligase (NAD+)